MSQFEQDVSVSVNEDVLCERLVCAGLQGCFVQSLQVDCQTNYTNKEMID